MIYPFYIGGLPFVTRTARNLSATNVYHAIQRGINKEKIFYTKTDYEKFLQILGEVKEISRFQLYTYCIMNNHIHYLIKAEEEPLGKVFNRIGSRFVPWYNNRYHRVGHLFQNRFKSEPVETESYFKTVIRYIIQNPLKAGLEPAPGNYKWTSYNDFVNMIPGLTDTAFPITLFGSRENLLEYINHVTDDQVLDLDASKITVSDDLAQQLFRKITSCSSVTEFRRFSKTTQRDYVSQLRNIDLTMTQIARLTGISISTVSRILHSTDDTSK